MFNYVPILQKSKVLYLQNYAKFVCSGIWCKDKNSWISVNLVLGHEWTVFLQVAAVWLTYVKCGFNVAYWPAWADCNLASKCVLAILLWDKYFHIKTALDQCVFLFEGLWNLNCLSLAYTCAVVLWNLLNLSDNLISVNVLGRVR